MIKEGLGDRSISNGLFDWHPRNLYTVGHQTIVMMKVKGMPFFIKEGLGNSEMGGGKEDQYLSLQIQMLSQRDKFRKKIHMSVESVKIVNRKSLPMSI